MCMRNSANKGFENYKPIRNLMRRYSRYDLIKKLAICSYNISKDFPKHNIPPHHVFLLIRWLIRDWENIRGNRIASSIEIRELVKKMGDFMNNVDSRWTEHEELTLTQKILRKMSYQQFWYQRKNNTDSIGRAIRLFLQSPIPDLYNKSMLDYCGYNCKDFFKNLLLICASQSYADKENFPK